MCGIAGIIGNRASHDNIVAMLSRMVHRGPDDQGVFVADNVAIGMRRLSIIDTEGSKQPIFNSDRSLAIVFNGEIYNYQALRRQLLESGHQFSTKGDTEVVLRLYEERGPACLDSLEGMFAFCIYNSRTGEVFLARDRLGKKPLYWTISGGNLIFSSELKGILCVPGVQKRLNDVSVRSYLSLRYVPGPSTLIKDVFKFPAATFGFYRHGDFKLSKWWSPKSVSPLTDRSDQSWQEEFDSLFDRAVHKRLISERPVGAFLSGGLDSAAIVSAMSKVSSHPVETFTVGFSWEGDELADADRVAKKLGCRHHPIRVSSDDILHFPEIVEALDEPIGDPIVLPMFVLAREAAKSVTVVLSGEGADEVLAGYFPHKILMYAHRYRQNIPGLMRKAIIPIVSTLPPSLLGLAFDYPAGLGRSGKLKLIEFLRKIEASDDEALYRHIISLFDVEDINHIMNHPVENEFDRLSFSDRNHPHGIAKNHLDQVLLLQYGHWLQDDILTKLDKMTMAHSIEGRNPFMDHQLVEFLLQAPPHLKLDKSMNKILLRRYLAKNVGSDVAARRKKPFYMPLEKYFESQGWAQMENDHLSRAAIESFGIFSFDVVQELRERRGQGDFIRDKQLFSVLALQIWMTKFL
jgi:asparagine synthase (glutamine-hydrolysing)